MYLESIDNFNLRTIKNFSTLVRDKKNICKSLVIAQGIAKYKSMFLKFIIDVQIRIQIKLKYLVNKAKTKTSLDFIEYDFKSQLLSRQDLKFWFCF